MGGEVARPEVGNQKKACAPVKRAAVAVATTAATAVAAAATAAAAGEVGEAEVLGDRWLDGQARCFWEV